MLSKELYKFSVSNRSAIKPLLIWGLILFFIAALLGLSMRVFWVIELPNFEYTNVLHAHSHLAMLGWGFTIICSLFIYFLGNHIHYFRRYKILLLANAIGCLAMTFAFVWKGYAIVSIALLIFHLLVAYTLGVFLLKDLKKLANESAALLAKWAVYWMFISTIGVWLLPVVIAKVGKLDPLYQSSIEWFLHLQFNGWFIYSILSLLLLFFENLGKNVKFTKVDFWGLQISLILTYALPAYWSYPSFFMSMLNSIGVLIQLLIFWRVILPLVISLRESAGGKMSIGYKLILLGLVSLLVKVTIQASLVFPLFLAASTEVHNFFIGFIHLLMLGVFTLICLGICSVQGLLLDNVFSKLGLGIVALGFLLTELILFAEGFLVWTFQSTIPAYLEILLTCTIFLPLGIGTILLSFAAKQRENIE